MTCDQATLLIDDYVDGACDAETAAAVRRHLSGCPPCRAMADDFSRIRDAAAGLGPIAPPARVWAGIQGRLHPDTAAAARGGWRQVLAAAAGFAVIATGLSWVGLYLSPAGAPQVVAVASGGQFELAAAAYQSAIDDLESITTEAEAPPLAEPAFVALQASLVDLDEVIGEARGRLTTEPDDEFTQESLLSALDNKVVLLQDALALLDQARTDGEGQNP